MLKTLRKKGVAKKVLWVVAIIIILSFGFFGTAYLLTGSTGPSHAGKIFGKTVSIRDFENAYQDVRIQAIMRYGDNYQQVSQFLDLEAETWDRLILRHEAEQQKIKISDEEVIKTIDSYPFFQRDGQFDTLLYNDILRYVFKVEAPAFENSVRDTLKFQKIFSEKTASVIVTDTEIADAYKQENEKIQVSYAIVKPENYTQEVPSEETALKNFYNDHKLEYILPPAIKVEYILVPWEKTIGEKAEDDNDPEQNDKPATFAKANQLVNTIKENATMQAVASKNNLQVETTDFFSMKQPLLTSPFPLSVLSQITKLEKGAIGGPYEANAGIMIVKVIDQRESYVPSYEEVKDQIFDNFRKEEAKKIAKEKAAGFLNDIKTTLNGKPAETFSSVAKSLKLELAQTPLFTRGTYLPGIGISPEFQQAAFALNEDNPISSPIEVPTGFAILSLDKKEGIDEEEFKKEETAIREQILDQKKSQTFSEYLSTLRLKANIINNLPKLRAAQQ